MCKESHGFSKLLIWLTRRINARNDGGELDSQTRCGEYQDGTGWKLPEMVENGLNDTGGSDAHTPSVI